MSKRKPLSLPALTKKLDMWFSRYIRMKGADSCGTTQCVTCGKLDHFKSMHASHFASRRHMATRWDERNVHVCCPRCNVFESGALDEYSRFILDTYGRETFDELLRLKHMTKKFTRDELNELIMKYQSLVNELEPRVCGG